MCRERMFFFGCVLAIVMLAQSSSPVSAGLPWTARRADFPQASRVARIEVTLSSIAPRVERAPTPIEQREQIAKVIAILSKHREGWKRVLVTPAAGQVAVHLASASTKKVPPLCTIRLGKGWMSTDIAGHCYWRAMSKEDQNDLLRSVGLDSGVLERVEDHRPPR